MDRTAAVIGALAIVQGLLGLAGCTKPPPPASASPPPLKAAAQDASAPEHESWEVYFMQSQPIGYGHTTMRRAIEAGRQVVLTESLNHLAIKRAGQLTEQDIRSQSVETPQGQLIRFTSDLRMGPTPVRTIGRVRGDRLDIETPARLPARRRKARLPGRPTAAGRWPWNRRFGSSRCIPANDAWLPP